MPYPYAFGETVVRRPWVSETTDAHGRTRPVYGADETIDHVGVGVDIVTETRTDGSERRVAAAWLYLAFDQPVDERDLWVARGLVWRVEGLPLRERNALTGWEPGCVVELRRVTG